ncbi:hypothetical protein SH203_00596 [Brevundimonas sp. SH203]|uniref:DUF2059 domain-containing protein n=1 Tax=Brevundimonas sp. SH203 TaxID=345167 RepID=UPI0009CD837D|nr:DUF2059 domain-containing protein [Brevundimonas sp. SH203]GAW40202.1 hypothetical protein SH203_00596 [Brevundimonas sp. SH203]
MTILRNLALGLALTLAATGVQARTQTETVVVTRVEPAPQDAGLARRSSLARELIGLSAGPNFAKEIERSIGAELEKIGDGQGEEGAWIRAAMPPMMSRMLTRLLDEMVPAYAEIYTEEELQGQIDFYRSPVGRAVAAKTVSMAVATQEVQVRALTDFMTELQGKYCARFTCETGQTGAKSRR